MRLPSVVLRWLRRAGLYLLAKAKCVLPAALYARALRRLLVGKRGYGFIHLHAIQLLLSAYAASKVAHEEYSKQDGPLAMSPSAVTALIMSVIAAEAFLNEMPEYIGIGQPPYLSPNLWATTDEMDACALALNQAEIERRSLVDKVQIASCALSGEKFSKGKAPLQDFHTLVNLRNEIVHLKPAWSTEDHRARRLVSILQRKGLTMKPEPGVDWSWFDVMQRPAVAEWACETVRQMLLALVDLCPDQPRNLPAYRDPLRHQKQYLREMLPPDAGAR